MMDEHYRRAEEGFLKGDCYLFKFHTSAIWTTEQYPRNMAQHHRVFLSRGDRLQLARYGLDLVRKLQRDCPPKTAATGVAVTQTAAAPRVEVSASGGGNFVELPDRGFIARELQGSGVQELNQVRPSTRSTGAGAQFKITVNDAPLQQSRLFINFNYFNSTASSDGAYDPGPNFRLNLPGATGGLSGVSIGGNPLNTITRLSFNNEIDSFGGVVGVSKEFASFGAPGGGLTTFGGILGIGGNRLTSNETFEGQIPGFGRDFRYSTNVEVMSGQIDLGVDLTQVLRPPGSGLLIVAYGALTVSPTVLSANGVDNFSFTGIAPSSADLSKTKTDIGASINGGLSFGLPGSTVSGNRINGPSVFVKGGYESRPGFPVIERDGTNPSRLELKRADIVTVSGGITVPFGGGIR